MTLNLKKGDVVKLRGELRVRKATFALGWNPRTSVSVNAPDFDLDSTAMLRTTDGRADEPNICWYHNLVVGNYMTHSQDDRTGAGTSDSVGSDKETITIDLEKVPSKFTIIEPNRSIPRPPHNEQPRTNRRGYCRSTRIKTP